MLEGVKGEDESEKESEVKETAQDLPITLCFCAMQVGCITNTSESTSVTVKGRVKCFKNCLQIEPRWCFKSLSPPHERAKKSRHNQRSSNGCVQEDELMNPAFMTEAQVEEETQKVRQFGRGWGIDGKMYEDRAALTVVLLAF